MRSSEIFVSFVVDTRQKVVCVWWTRPKLKRKVYVECWCGKTGSSEEEDAS